MKLRRASVRIDGGLDSVDSAVRMLEDEWRRHGDVHLESFWADHNRMGADCTGDSVAVLAELVKTDLRRRFDAGQRPTVAEYLDRFPDLASADSRVLSLVYEEFCLCEERDGCADVDSFCERYSDWKSSLESQLRCHRLISQAAGAHKALPRFPKPGETFEEFELLAQLGKGGTSRVFLARDLSLGGKNVALKVTLDRGQEPRIQGPLDHPHIVPVNSVTYPAGGELCGLSMPYQPGLPLDEIIKRVKPSRRPARALALWSSLVDVSVAPMNPGSQSTSAPVAQPHPQGDGWSGFPTSGTYSQGAAWTAMVLARALDYAHKRKIHHRDVKPANVLLTINHGPQLLDFNLAESPHSADHAQAALRGGTLPYMAPEQIRAFLNPEQWSSVDSRADIYSLGLVLRELLTGQMPDLPPKGLTAARAMNELLDRRPYLDTAVRRFNPAIPPSLEAIVAKCLALNPADRYTDAGSLATDLDRFLNHQPLLEAVNRSRRERLKNYWVRQRTNVSRIGFAVAGVLVLALIAGIASKAHEWLWPREPLADPVFRAAVAALEERDAYAAKQGLLRLASSFPRSCLTRFYLAFAIKDNQKSEPNWKSHSEAKRCLSQALAAVDAEKTVLAWSEQHPEFCKMLIDFVDYGTDRADEFAEKYDKDDPDREVALDSELRLPGYDLFRQTLALAEKLDPSSLRIRYLLAKTDGVFEGFQKSHERLTEVIESLRQAPNIQKELLFFCRHLRGRVAFLRVEQQRKQGERLTAETVKFLEEAIVDLDFCGKYLDLYRWNTAYELKDYRVTHDRLRANLNLFELTMDLEWSSEAEARLRSCEKLRRTLIEKAGFAKVDRSAFEGLIRRFEDANRRFEARWGSSAAQTQTANCKQPLSGCQIYPMARGELEN